MEISKRLWSGFQAISKRSPSDTKRFLSNPKRSPNDFDRLRSSIQFAIATKFSLNATHPRRLSVQFLADLRSKLSECLLLENEDDRPAVCALGSFDGSQSRLGTVWNGLPCVCQCGRTVAGERCERCVQPQSARRKESNFESENKNKTKQNRLREKHNSSSAAEVGQNFSTEELLPKRVLAARES